MGKIINKYSKISKILDSLINPFINFSKKLQNSLNPLFSNLPPLDNKSKSGFAGGLWSYAFICGLFSLFKIFQLFGLMMSGLHPLKVLGVLIGFFLTYIYFSSIDGLRHSRKSGYDLLYLATFGEIIIFILFAVAGSFSFLNLLMLVGVLYILSQTKNNFR